ncbi:DUF222 domain-containing protein [Arthrobacter sp. A5]|uniref:DUF222 domain-containing protein n=1 Tax=Arthrobacter sp. A5 TaxID=576926 RepID=UPI003DA93098
MNGEPGFEALLEEYLGRPEHARPGHAQGTLTAVSAVPFLPELIWGPSRPVTDEDLRHSLMNRPALDITAADNRVADGRMIDDPPADPRAADVQPPAENNLPDTDLQPADLQPPADSDLPDPGLPDTDLQPADVHRPVQPADVQPPVLPESDLASPDVRLAGLQDESARRALLAALVREEDPDPLDPLRAAAALLFTDPTGGDAGQNLDYAAAAGKMMSWAQAIQARAVAAFAAERPPLPAETPRNPRIPGRREWLADKSKWAAAEIGAALHTSHYSAQRLLNNSEDLTIFLPVTLALQEQGILDRARVQAVLYGLGTTPATLWGPVEAAITALAPSLTPRALERYARETAEKLDPEPLAARHERARTHRDVWFLAQPDGMAEIGALLPAVDARRFYETIDAWAHHAQHEGEPSTGTTPGGKPSRAIAEYRADVLMDLFDLALDPDPQNTTNNTTGNGSTGNGSTGNGDGSTGNGSTGNGDGSNGDGDGSNGDGDGSSTSTSTGSGAGSTGVGASGGRGRKTRRYPPAQVAVTVPVLTLMGLDERPGNLDGYGPIPADQARELAGLATSWLRFLTDPETGTILSIGRNAYTPAADLRRWIINRDKTCRGIGCDKPARSCEIDHTIPYHRQTYAPDGTPLPLGETSDTNLGAFCAFDHHLKDDPGTGWTVSQPTPGVFIHTSPTGRVYPNNPELPPPF